MKITKNDLKKLIMEELQKIDEISPQQKAANIKAANKRLAAGIPSLGAKGDKYETYVERINPKNINKPLTKEEEFEAFIDETGKIYHGGLDIGGSPKNMPADARPVMIKTKSYVLVSEVEEDPYEKADQDSRQDYIKNYRR